MHKTFNVMGPALLAALALGCNPFNRMPDNTTTWVVDPLWDDDVVAAADGIYARLPQAGQLVRIREDGSFSVIDLDGAEPLRLVVAPGDQHVLAFGRWPECKDDDEDIELVSDCPEEDLRWNSELSIIAEGKRTDALDIPSHLNALEFSEDGRYAVAYLDEDEGGVPEDIDGVMDLSEVMFIDLEAGESSHVSIGFSPNNILFTDDGTKAVVMSRSKVVVVDLSSFDEVVSYPLTLDADQDIDPSDAVLTPDGSKILVSIQGSSLLYKLDLDTFSIDIEDLDGAPADLAVHSPARDDSDPGETLIVYSSLSQVDVLSHEDFELDSPIELDDPVTGILMGEDFAVLYNDTGAGYRDVYKLDLGTTELTEFVVDNPVNSMQLAESGAYAVGVLQPESSSGSDLDSFQDRNWGLAVVDLVEEDTVSLVVEAQPVGLALIEDDSGSFALVLMDGVESLLQIDLASPSTAKPIDLPAAPTNIGAMPDGKFFITHSSALGLVSFLDPATGKIETIGGFASAEVLPEQPLPRRGED